MTQAPGANYEAKSGGITIDGASAGENRFVVDGVETTNPQTGVQGKTMVLDFVGRRSRSKSSGYTAEFGGSTGGVVNVITRSGSNDFRGDAGFYFNNDNLNGAERRTLRLCRPTRAAEYITLPEGRQTRRSMPASASAARC